MALVGRKDGLARLRALVETTKKPLGDDRQYYCGYLLFR